MAQNRALQRSLACLIHPATIGSLALLLLNDHLFRVYWPGLWTGKLGEKQPGDSPGTAAGRDLLTIL